MAMTPRVFGARGKRRASALGIDPERLPPGQSPTVKWPVLSLGQTPRIATGDWRLSVDGAVAHPYVLDWAQLQAVPQTDWSGDIHCVTRWSKFAMDWRGVSVRDLIERAEPDAEATHLMAHCYGGYTTNLPLSDVTEHPALIAHTVDGGPLRERPRRPGAAPGPPPLPVEVGQVGLALGGAHPGPARLLGGQRLSPPG